jgi:benzoate membrane transport protein
MAFGNVPRAERSVGTATSPTATIPSPKWVKPASVAIPVTIFAISALAYPLAVAPALGLSIDQRTTWILGLYLFPAIASFLLTYIYQIPLIVGWSGPAIIFLASLGATTAYSDILGAMVVTGIVLMALGASGLSGKLAAFIPAPIVFGVVAGTILPFLIDAFSFLGSATLLIGSVLLAWIIARKYLEPRVPAVLAAFAVGVAVAWLTGETGAISSSSVIPTLALTWPTFELAALITIVPVFVILIAANSNLSGSVVIRNAGYDPPRKMIDVVSGLGVLGGSLLGAIPLAFSVNLNAMTLGEEAGDRERRHWSVYASAVGFLIIAGAAAIAADLPNLIPMSLLLSVAALALLGVFIQMLGEMTRGPILIGPVVALAVSLSDLSLLGLGAFFWALVLGTLITRILEPDALADHCAAIESTEGWCRVPAGANTGSNQATV